MFHTGKQIDKRPANEPVANDAAEHDEDNVFQKLHFFNSNII